jgi:hypothetical protein
VNREDLRNLALYWLDDENGGYFKVAQVNRFLNNALRECQKHLLRSFENRYVECFETTMVANQAWYVLPTDFLKLNRLEIITSGTAPNEEIRKLEFLTLNQKEFNLSKTGTPYGYYFLKGKLGLTPVPDTGLTLRLYYTYRIAEMDDDTDVPDIPTEYQEFLSILAAMDGLIKDGRDPSALLIKKNEYIDMLRRDAENRNVDKARMVVITDGGGFDPLF